MLFDKTFFFTATLHKEAYRFLKYFKIYNIQTTNNVEICRLQFKERIYDYIDDIFQDIYHLYFSKSQALKTKPISQVL